MQALKEAVDGAGGVAIVARACGKTPRAIYKWLSTGKLPRTEYTGETSYAEIICALLAAKGVPLAASDLLAGALATMPVTIPASGSLNHSTGGAVCLSSTTQASA